MEKIKQFHNKFIEKHGSLHLILLMIIGICCKNFLLQAYAASSNTFRPNFINAFIEMLPAAIFNVAVLAIFFSFIFLFKGRGKWIYALCINIVFTVIIYVDLLYFRSFNTYPSIKMLLLVKNVPGLGVHPLDWISIFDIFFVLDLIAFPFLAYFYEKNKSGEKPYEKKYIKSVSLFLSGALILGFLPICSIFNGFPKAFDTVYRPAYEKNVSLYFTAPGFHIIDIVDAIFGSDETELKDEQKAQIEEFYAWNDENLPDNEYAGIIKDKNVIVVQMESIEAFVLGQSVCGQEITPNLNKILKNSISFSHIYEQTKSGNSSDCDFMTMTGILPIKKLNLFNSFADSDVTFNSSAKILRNNGYYTSYYNAIASAVWNYEGCIDGFMDFDNIVFDFKRDKLINIYIPDDYLLEQVCDKIAANENTLTNPYFAQIILGTSHMPYDLPEEYKYLNIEGELEDTTIENYLNAAHYVDMAIGKFLEKAEQSGILENTVILFTGDHCGIHKYFPMEIEKLAKEEGYEWLRNCDDATLPFIVYDCDGDTFTGENIDTIGGQIDILPTLLYMLGVDKNEYKNTVMGRNLLNTNRNFTVRANGEILGEISESDEYVVMHMYDTADLIIRSNYYLEYLKRTRK